MSALENIYSTRLLRTRAILRGLRRGRDQRLRRTQAKQLAGSQLSLLPCRPGFFVKYGSYSSAYPAYLTQVFLANAAKAVPEVHVPEVHHFFYRDKGMAYVVMENIQLIDVRTEELVQKTAYAVKWMRDVKAPNEGVLGPLGSGRAYHVLFKDRKAPLDFTGVKAVERFLNKAVASPNLDSMGRVRGLLAISAPSDL
ncbi:hypothetical protein FS837_001741, partial [Tulasnella sp. UAMH 9824]